MATERKLRRGTELEHESFTGAVGELTAVTDNPGLRLHDGVTPGGHAAAMKEDIPMYKGLWPDTDGSADEGDTYQTQTDGTPTGLYFTALQNTSVDPVNDNVNWRAINDYGTISQGLVVTHRHGTTTDIESSVPANGEIWKNDDDGSIHVGDGAKLGGYKIPHTKAANVVKYTGVSDDNDAFEAALSSADVVIFDSPSYNLTGEVLIPSNKLIVINKSNINWTLDGENGRGFFFGEGTENSYIVGTGRITGAADTLGSDGSRNGIISFGSDYYLTSDPLPTKKCGIVGKFTLESIGSANVKLVQGYGYVEDIDIEVLEGKGQSNFPVSFHWVGNGSVGTLPTKTWHPHHIRVRNSHVFDDGSGNCLRAFTFSACGRVDIDDCTAGCTTINYNFFVGDYGYTYAQNITNADAFDFHFSKLKSYNNGTPLSIDAVSSELNGSPKWVGSAHNASVIGRDFSVKGSNIDNLDNILIAPTGLDKLVIHDLDIKEVNLSQTREWINAVGCNYIELDGDVVTVKNSRFRSTDKVVYNVNSDKAEFTPDNTSVTLQLESSSGSCTLQGSVAVGDTEITVINSDIEVYSGGVIKWGNQRAKLTSPILNQTAAQTVGVEPMDITIADATVLTVCSIVAEFDAGPVHLKGSRNTVALLGDATARPEKVTFNGTDFGKCGLFYVDAQACEGLTMNCCTHEDGGFTTTTANTYGINLGADCDDFAIIAPRFGKRNKKMRYLIRVDDDCENGVIDLGRYESINASATNPAAISINAATNVTIGAGNIVSNGVALQYP